MLRTVIFMIILFAAPAAWSATSGSFDDAQVVGGAATSSASSGSFDEDFTCKDVDAKSTALALYNWINDEGDTSDAILRQRVKRVLSPELYARFSRAQGDFIRFFTPAPGQDFYFSNDVPITVAKIGTTAKGLTKVTMIVTFDENFGRKPHLPLPKVMTLIMSGGEGPCIIENAHNGKKWLLRHPR
jgi:hypothetical protein